MKHISFRPIWFDSLGAKSSCVLVWTKDVRILIDPGAAIMQPSFPANLVKKLYWLAKAKLSIRKSAKSANVVVISHYHYDHFVDFDKQLYEHKIVFAKNPNEFINESQRKRAETFFQHYCRSIGKQKLKTIEIEEKEEYEDAIKELSRNLSKETFEKGLKWFKNLSEKWKTWERIPELSFKNGSLKFPEGKTFTFGRTKLQMSEPFFHGVEFSKIGWIFSTIVKHGKEKLIHSSDLNGPVIENYAEWIIDQNPNILILDGPSTYMLGYLVAKSNLKRAVKNAERILEEASNLEILIYDHHLLREPKFKEKTAEVWKTGERKGVKVLTAAEFLGRKPVVLG
ncbi:MAG: MBL fold metallo-hydrolase [Candidatus Hadarchaeales archaeon]